MVSIPHATAYALDKGFLTYSRYSKEEKAAQQTQLSADLEVVNKAIIQLNNTPQHLSVCGQGGVRCPQLYWHHLIEKESYKRRHGQKTKVCRRVAWTRTVDGVHAVPEIALKWFDTTHTNIMKMCKSIQAIYNLYHQ